MIEMSNKANWFCMQNYGPVPSCSNRTSTWGLGDMTQDTEGGGCQRRMRAIEPPPVLHTRERYDGKWKEGRGCKQKQWGHRPKVQQGSFSRMNPKGWRFLQTITQKWEVRTHRNQELSLRKFLFWTIRRQNKNETDGRSEQFCRNPKLWPNGAAEEMKLVVFGVSILKSGTNKQKKVLSEQRADCFSSSLPKGRRAAFTGSRQSQKQGKHLKMWWKHQSFFCQMRKTVPGDLLRPDVIVCEQLGNASPVDGFKLHLLLEIYRMWSDSTLAVEQQTPCLFITRSFSLSCYFMTIPPEAASSLRSLRQTSLFLWTFEHKLIHF